MRKPPHEPLSLDAKSFQRVMFNTVLLVFGLVFLSRVASEAIGPLVFVLLAAVLTMGLNPLVVRLESGLRIPRRFGAVAVVLGILALAVGFMAVVLPLFVAQGARFSENVPGMMRQMQETLAGLVERFPLLAPLAQGGSSFDLGRLLAEGGVFGNLLGVASRVAGLVAQTAALLIVVLFLLMSPEPIVRGIMSGIPPHSRPVVEKTLIRVGSQLGKWLFAILITSAIKGVLMGVGLWLVGFENALLFGMVAALTNPIPFVGPWIGVLLPVFTAIAEGDWVRAALAVGVLAVSEVIDNNLLTPVVLGRTVEIHPASMLLGVLVFGAFLGLAGIFLTVPIAIILKALYEEVYLTSLGRPDVPDETVAHVVAAGQGDDAVEDSQGRIEGRREGAGDLGRANPIRTPEDPKPLPPK